MTTTNYRKPRAKQRTKAQQLQFEQSHREYNKSMKRMGCHDQMMTLENYDLYCRGLYKPKLKGVYVAPANTPYQRETTHYASVGDGMGIAPKKEPNVYTGTLIVGIATMHKSNAVPILNQQEAIDISNMRR